MCAATLHDGGHRLRVVRALVIGRHGPWCARCHGSIDLALSGLAPMGLTLGHIMPVSQGGSDALDNLRPEHRRCNLAAGARAEPPRARIVTP